jgi:hypothetical protein
VKEKAGHAAGGVLDEIDLGVDDLEEVPRLRLGEELDLGLPGGLGNELVAAPEDRDREARSELVLAGERCRPSITAVAFLGEGRGFSVLVNSWAGPIRDWMRRPVTRSEASLAKAKRAGLSFKKYSDGEAG